MSPPVRRRGLKPIQRILIPWKSRVASRAEAWIETDCRIRIFPRTESPPVRRRGLKHWFGFGATYEPVVASRAEAWIETSFRAAQRSAAGVASRAEAWIETV